MHFLKPKLERGDGGKTVPSFASNFRPAWTESPGLGTRGPVLAEGLLGPGGEELEEIILEPLCF